MSQATHQKSTVEEIRQRFDNDVERFSVLSTGQSSTIDAPLVLDIITSAAANTTPTATHLLDIGCGAGNNTLKFLEKGASVEHIELIDLSRPMLTRAQERISARFEGVIHTHQVDIQKLDLGESRFDVIFAAAVLHHLREDAAWELVFSNIYRALKPGGSVWISDLIQHSTAGIQGMMWARYGEYLTELKDEAYRDHVFAYVEKEDTPRPLLYQIDLLRQVGFTQVDILHKNSMFAAFGGIK